MRKGHIVSYSLSVSNEEHLCQWYDGYTDCSIIGLRVTPDTELGDNLTIKEPPKMPNTPFPNRGKRRAAQTCGSASTTA
jgi:hypothetical protein